MDGAVMAERIEDGGGGKKEHLHRRGVGFRYRNELFYIFEEMKGGEGEGERGGEGDPHPGACNSSDVRLLAGCGCACWHVIDHRHLSRRFLLLRGDHPPIGIRRGEN